MGLQFSITAIGSVVVQTSVNGLGVNAVAAVSAAGKLSALFACVFDSLASTMATFAGQNMGARRLDSGFFNSNREELFYDDCIDVNTVENVEFALSTCYKRTQYDIL